MYFFFDNLSMEKEINISEIADKSVCLEWFELEGNLIAVTSEGICKITKSSYLNNPCYDFYMEHDDRTPTNSFSTLEKAKEWARTMYVDEIYRKMTNVIDVFNQFNKNKDFISVK